MERLSFSKTLKISLWIPVLFIFTLLMLLPSPEAQAKSLSRPYTKGKRGQEAVTAFKKRLPKIASRYGKSTEKLKEIFLHDKDLWVDPEENLMYLCNFDASETEGLPESADAAIPSVPLPLEQTFQLHSLPEATKVIYLDFDGHVTSGTYWNDGADIVSVPYDFDGNSSSFSDTELSRIQRIWARVAEDFAIFAIDVTTEDPGIEALRKSTFNDEQYGIRVVISPSSSWYGSAGGVAYVGSFDWSNDTPTFVFSNLLGNGNEKYVTDAISHETGHTLGLSHDGTKSGTAYYQGHGDWAPIMGVGYYEPITQWSKGEYADANNTEDDLAVMLNNGATYRMDDHGDWIDNPTMLAGEILDAAGIIERTDDMDVFGFQTAAGDISINIDPLNLDPNLDILVQVLDDGGNVIGDDDPYYILPASLNLNLPAGTYYILIDGVGTGDPDTGYSDYASLGQYFISGTIPSTDIVPVTPADLFADPASFSQINLSWADNSSNEIGFSIERSANGIEGWTEIGFSSADIAVFTDTGLSEITTYHYRVAAYNVIGSSDYSNTAEATTFDLPPSAPTELIATAASANQIGLSWADNSDNENGFAIQRSPDGVEGWIEIATTADNITTYGDTELTPGSSFFYRVAAYNENGNSGFSNVADATTDEVLPEGPSNLVAVTVSASQVNLAWADNSENEDGFKIERSANGIDGWIETAVQDANVTTYSNIELDPNTTYFYRVFSYNSAGNSGYSIVTDATTDELPPEAPADLSATAVSPEQINLSWLDNADKEDGYIVERSSDGTNWNDIAALDANVTSYTDTSPSLGTSNFYRVYAFNSAGISDFSNVAAIPVSGALNFYDYILGTYAGSQDVEGTVIIENEGLTLDLTGNRWQQIAFAYTITPDTVIEFDFQSTAQGEIHAIGFDNNTSYSSDRTFQLHGSQSWGIQDFNNYAGSGDVQHCRIEVGNFYTGEMQYLFFAMDHDVSNPTGNSVFSNIKVYEDTGAIPPSITSTPFTEAMVDESYTYDADSTVEAIGTGLITFSLGYGPDSMSVSSNGLVTWMPGAGQEGVHAVQIIADNDWGTATQIFEISVEPALTPPSITSTPITEATIGAPYNYDADSVVEATGSGVISFSLGYGPDSMGVSNEGLVTWMPGAGQEGTHTVEIIATNAWGTDTQVFEIIVAAPPALEGLNFYDFILGSYAGSQDVVGTVTIENGGAALNLTGNRWQQINFDYIITPDTVIEFDFQSAAQGEIHAIGFDNNTSYSSDRTFQLYGSQSWGIQDFNNYAGSGDVQHYRIEIGSFYTGEMQYLFFAMDHDVSDPTGNSIFSNIRVYEDIEGTPPTITSTPITEATIGAPYNYEADSTVEATGSGLITFSLGYGPDSMSVSSAGLVTWVPGDGQEGVHGVEIVATNDWGTDTQVFEIIVAPAPAFEGLNFYDFILGSYAGSQDVEGTVTIENGGAALNLTGNRWQQIEFDYIITPNTVIEFDFQSAAQGEIHAIGFDNNTSYSSDKTFQLHGSQSWGIQDFNNYAGSGDVQHYRIEIGSFYTGEMQNLFFAMDHDVSDPTGNSVFSNIKIYEAAN